MFIKYTSAFSADNCVNFWESEGFSIVSIITSDFLNYTIVTLTKTNTKDIIVITCNYSN